MKLNQWNILYFEMLLCVSLRFIREWIKRRATIEWFVIELDDNWQCGYFAGPLNNRLQTISEDGESQFDLPPPYTPGQVQNTRKLVTVISTRAPNEPPPPYDIGREATEVWQ